MRKGFAALLRLEPKHFALTGLLTNGRTTENVWIDDENFTVITFCLLDT